MIKDRLNKDLVTALKSGDTLRIATLRLLNAAIYNKEIEKRSKTGRRNESLTDEETVKVLQNEAKKRKEAIELYHQGGRADLMAKEKAELEVIEEYLPKELSDEELEDIINEVFKELNPSGPADFGRIMGAVMKKVEGRASGSRVRELIQNKWQ